MKKIYLLTILLTTSCIGNNKNNQINVVVDYENLKTFTRIDSIPKEIDLTLDFKEVNLYENPQLYKAKYVKLSDKGGYISNANKIEIFNDLIYILDTDIHNVFIYNMNGELVKRIHDRGRAGNEYLAIDDIAFTSDMLVISDRMAPYVLYYTLKGEFIRKEKFNIQSVNRAILNDSLYINIASSSQNNGTPIDGKHLIASIGDSVVATGFNFEPLQENPMMLWALSLNYRDNKGEMSLFRPHLSDTIYHINKDFTYYPKYVFKSKFSYWEYKDESDYTVDKKVIKRDYSFLSFFFFEEDNELLFDLVKNSRVKSIVYDLNDKNKSRVFSYAPPLNLNFKYNDKYVSYSSGFSLSSLYDKYKSGEVELKDKELIELISGIDEDSNGVVSFITLND